MYAKVEKKVVVVKEVCVREGGREAGRERKAVVVKEVCVCVCV